MNKQNSEMQFFSSPKQTNYEEEYLLSAFSVKLCSSFHLSLFLISFSLHLTVGKMKGDTGTGCELHQT